MLVPGRTSSWTTKYKETAAAAKSLQSCPTLCDPIDSSLLGSSVPGILQARILEWVTIFFSNAWKWKVKVKSLSCAWLLATPWTAAYQAPLSMGFSWQEYWNGLPLPSPTKKLHGTKNNCVHIQLGQNYGQKIQTKNPNCHFWRAWSKTRVLGAKAAYCACSRHTHHLGGGQNTKATPLAQPLDPLLLLFSR